ncbi:DUF4114 domain-containing protein [Kamptonema sp. UHCC 0994]|uniref:DUF4114 domain-containing protein n=1 Tax=Kamptonema sp. UHCC 0994 TaxID=3031329 RepID=UPI0023B894DE|nr:DUF4114 domain-containing protein [Kamptonema sp. UHCC 0994]MDF0555630.1 DUF4114 domain-containing protein [Kamptonema sp. UHCC 0994]
MDELPLLELFMRLREAGLPLGVDEYNLLLRALQAGFGISDCDALARLCCNLWVKSDEQKRLFDYHFEQVIVREFYTKFSATSELGIFTVGSTGKVGIDYLLDGGEYKGELAIFSLAGLDKYEPGSREFIQKAVNRALSNSELGYLVINKRQQQARLNATLSGDEKNNSEKCEGFKTFEMRPGDTFGIMLVPNGQVQQLVDNHAVEGVLRSLFLSVNVNELPHVGQIADVWSNASTFVLEDMRVDDATDRDYNDFIFQVRGAVGRAVHLDEIGVENKDWRKSELGKALVVDIQSHTALNSENTEEAVNQTEEKLRAQVSGALDNPIDVEVYNESERAAVIDLFIDIWEQAKQEPEFADIKKFSRDLDLQELLNLELEEDITTLTLDSTAKLTLEVEDEVQVAKSLLQSAGEDEEISESSFILTSEYFPVTKRQMKQCWRFLRRPIREGPPVELDVEATVKRVGREGIMVSPVLVPRRVNRTELLLLIDYGGSMVPFHALSRRLAETAVRGGRLGKADIYYFHNCPVEYVYPAPHSPAAKRIGDMVEGMRSDRAAILIFSDGGAARGGWSQERIELTKEFLEEVKKKVRYVAWLNPMSRQRWQGTSAEEVEKLVPMFEMTRRGLQAGINLLRGRAARQEF